MWPWVELQGPWAVFDLSMHHSLWLSCTYLQVPIAFRTVHTGGLGLRINYAHRGTGLAGQDEPALAHLYTTLNLYRVDPIVSEALGRLAKRTYSTMA